MMTIILDLGLGVLIGGGIALAVGFAVILYAFAKWVAGGSH